MKSASTIYKMLRALDTSWYEWKVVQGQHTYESDKLKNVDVSFSLITEDGIDIGNANAAKCSMTILEESANWDRMAQFTIQFRISSANGGTKSGWMTLGKFYTDERSEDQYGNLKIVGYDAMLKLEQSWADKVPEQLMPATFPITAKAWGTMIEAAELADFEDLTQLDDTVAFVGLDTAATIRDTLKTIAAAHAGNWLITTTETLNLIQFVNADPEVASSFLNLQLATQSLDDSPALPAVSGVHLETESGTLMDAGDDDGYVVMSICDVSSTTGVAALCLSKIEDYVYQPFTAGVAYLDPRADVGDSLKIKDTMYQIMSIDWKLGRTPTATVSAPYDQEIDHEFVIPSAETKMYRKAMSGVDLRMGQYATQIEQNEQAITLLATHTEEIDQQIASLQNQIDGNIQSWSGNVVPTLNNSPASDWTTSALKAEHVGDLYFVNSDAGIPEAGTYYRFEENNGVYSWVVLSDTAITEALTKAAAALAAAESAEDAAEESLDVAQSKGRIFVTQPPDAQAYDVGDLWVNATYGSTYSNDVLRCKTAKAAGDAFNIAHWELASKYTDDAAVNALRTEVEAELSVQADNIAAKVSQTGGNNTTNSFSWQLNSSGHRWYANGGVDPVVSITGTGLAVKGEINAISGYIGNGSSGFTIGNTSIYNGMTSLNDTEHFGVYLGTDGISLGKGAFRVTNTGQLYAQSGTFEGNVYAKNINYGGNYGTLSGAGITEHTIGDANIAQAGNYGALTTASLSQGVQGSLALADGYGLAITQGTSSYPPYFTAGSVYGTSSVASRTFSVENASGEELYHLNDHYHSFTEVNGKIVIGIPHNNANVDNRSFNIADTQTYRDGVSAVTIASGNVVATTGSNVGSYSAGFDFDLTDYLYTPPASPNIAFGRIEIKNASGTLLKRLRVQVPNNTTSVTVTGASGLASDSSNYTTYDLAASFASSSIYDSGSTLYARTQVTLSNGVTSIIRAAIPDTSGSVTAQSITGVTTDSTNYTTYDLTVNRSAAQIYTTSSYQYGRATITLSNGNTSTIRMRMPNQSSSVTMSSVTGLTTSSTDYTTYDFTVSRGASTLYTSGSYTYGRATITLSNGNTSTLRFRVPSISGVNSITVDRPTGTSDDWEIEDNNVFVKVNLAAKNGTTIVYSGTGRVNVNDIVNFWAEEAYDHAGTLVTNSSNYTTYDTGYSWGTRLFNPTLSSGGSSVYGRLGIYNSSNSLLATLRLALSMSVVSASTSSDYSDYYTSGGDWYLKVHVKNSSTEIYQTGINVQHAVNYGKQNAVSWVQLLSSDYSLANKQATLYCYDSNNNLIYQQNVRISYDPT